MAIGLLLIASALSLTGYNLWEESRAQKTAAHALRQLQSVQPEQPEYEMVADMEMPVIAVDGRQYIGVVEIPALSLSLPVIGEWSNAGLKSAPCRYTGSAYRDDLIIAGHNYRSHFGRLKELRMGDSVQFTDTDGNEFSYVVTEIAVLDGTDVEEMQSGEWDLTLFTCTVGGTSRVTVRCARSPGETSLSG